MLTDSHAHLFLDTFDEDRKALMQRAADKNVRKIYLPNIDSSTTAAMLKMETDFPGQAFPMMGLHPCSVKENVKEELAHVKEWLGKHAFAAVGEIGLDFYWDTSFKEQQIAAFEQQIDWAIAYDLPIVIHARNATRECIDIVRSKQNGKLKGVFHCFSGTPQEAQEVIDLGFYMGIGGIITFKRSALPELVRETPLQHLILETDAPYLTPAPHRGKRNESSYIPLIAEKIAEIKGITSEEVAEVTSANVASLYKL